MFETFLMSQTYLFFSQTLDKLILGILGKEETRITDLNSVLNTQQQDGQFYKILYFKFYMMIQPKHNLSFGLVVPIRV